MGFLDSLFKPDVEKLRNKRDIQGLAKALKHEDTVIRTKAATALGELGNSLGDNELRSSAIDALVKIGKPAVKTLIAALSNSLRAVDVRIAATTALGEIQDAEAVDPLIAALGDNSLRSSAIEALSKIGTPSIKPLLSMLSSNSKAMKEAAIDALQRIDYKPSSESEKITYYFATKRWDELVKIGTPAVKTLIAALNESAPDVRIAAVRTLGEIKNEEAVLPLLGLFYDTLWTVKEAALDAIIKIGKLPAVQTLLAKLEDKDCKIRKVAAESLYKLDWKASNDNEAVLYLSASDLLSKGKYSDIIKYGDIAVTRLLSLLNDTDCTVKQAAIDALGEIGDKRAIVPIINVVQNEADPVVRNSAIDTLADLGGVDTLVPLLSNSKSDLKRSLILALSKLNYSAHSIEDQIEFNMVAKQWNNLVKIGKPAVKTLIAAMSNSEFDMRIGAAKTLGEMQEEEAIIPLIEMLDENDGRLQNAAVNALVSIGTAATLPLISALKSDNAFVREKVIEALGEINNPAALEHIISALNDNDSVVCLASLKALSKVQDIKIVDPIINVASTVTYPNVKKAAIETVMNLKPMVMKTMESNPSIREAAQSSLLKIDNIVQTEQKRLEAERREAERRAEEAKREAERRAADAKREAERRAAEARRAEEQRRVVKVKCPLPLCVGGFMDVALNIGEEGRTKCYICGAIAKCRMRASGPELLDIENLDEATERLVRRELRRR